MTKGPIVIVDDDPDDREIYEQIIGELGLPNELRLFERALPALDYLRTTEEQPFIILSDINMPMMDGLEFKTIIQSEPYLQQKGIPFVYISTNATSSTVRRRTCSMYRVILKSQCQ